jgi:hypothetical protein
MEKIIWDKKFKITGDNVFPEKLNYKIEPLHPKEIYDNNENLTSIEYYKSWVAGVFSDLVIKEDILYYIDANDFLEREDTVITWYLEDDTAYPYTKTIVRHYNILQAIEYGKSRRGRQIDRAKIYVKTNELYAVITEAQMNWLLSSFMGNMSLYKEGDEAPLLAQVTSAPEAYLDNNDYTTNTTIRLGILAIITDTP